MHIDFQSLMGVVYEYLPEMPSEMSESISDSSIFRICLERRPTDSMVWVTLNVKMIASDLTL